jgi:hypothetical protein
MAVAHIGQLSAFVYNVKSPQAAEASATESLYGPAGSVRMVVQLLIATISPWRVGFPIKEFWFTPVQIRSPRLPVEVWLTMAVPKAAKGQDDPEATRASLAARIQWARVEGGMPLTVSPVPDMGCCVVSRGPSERCAAAKLLRVQSEASRVWRRAILCEFNVCCGQECSFQRCDRSSEEKKSVLCRTRDVCEADSLD